MTKTKKQDSKPTFSCATFDIETTSLDAVGAGVILCAVVKPLGEKPKIFRYDDMHLSPGNDKFLVRSLVNELCKYDLLIGHNARRFDWNFIRTRALIHNIQIPKRPFLYDTMEAFKRLAYLTVPNRIGKPTARLDHVTDMFGVKQRKTSIYPREHWRTVWGNKKERRQAMNELVDHCVSDTQMNEDIYGRLFDADSSVTLKRVK